MEFINNFYITALYLAVEKENIEIVKHLLAINKLDINILNILIQNILSYLTLIFTHGI